MPNPTECEHVWSCFDGQGRLCCPKCSTPMPESQPEPCPTCRGERQVIDQAYLNVTGDTTYVPCWNCQPEPCPTCKGLFPGGIEEGGILYDPCPDCQPQVSREHLEELLRRYYEGHQQLATGMGHPCACSVCAEVEAAAIAQKEGR